jgi:hypothetical protein
MSGTPKDMIFEIKKLIIFGVGCHGLTPNIKLWCRLLMSTAQKKSIFKNKKTLEPRYMSPPISSHTLDAPPLLFCCARATPPLPWRRSHCRWVEDATPG